MSDTTVTTEAPRNDAGQFQSTEPAYGREGLERDAGYVPLKDEAKEETPPELTKDEAAEQRIKELSGSESKIKTWTAGLDANVSLTAEQAGEMLAEGRKAEKAEADDSDDVKTAEQERIDKMRGVDKKEAPQAESEDDLEERALKSPRIRDAINARISEAETQRQHHEAAVAHATNFAVAGLFADLPELSNLPVEQWADAINEMHNREPARAALAVSRLQAIGHVEAANRQIAAQKTAREQAALKEHNEREHARYVDLIKDVPERDQAAVTKHLPKMFAEYGVDMNQFIGAIASQTSFPRSIAQALLVKAARYDLMTKAAKALPTRAAVPRVQMPGAAAPRVDRNQSNIQALSAKLARSGSLKDAVALRMAKAKGR